jgi:hypothetical protein
MSFLTVAKYRKGPCWCVCVVQLDADGDPFVSVVPGLTFRGACDLMRRLVMEEGRRSA